MYISCGFTFSMDFFCVCVRKLNVKTSFKWNYSGQNRESKDVHSAVPSTAPVTCLWNPSFCMVKSENFDVKHFLFWASLYVLQINLKGLIWTKKNLLLRQKNQPINWTMDEKLRNFSGVCVESFIFH